MTTLRHINDSTGIRLTLAAAVGVLAGLLAFLTHLGLESLLIGWDVAVITFVVWVYAIIVPLDARETARYAGREDPSTVGSNFILLLASFASLAAVGAALVDAHAAHGVSVFFLTGISIVSIILSWLLIHTIFTLHYARIYYNDRIEGSIDFNQSAKPTYTDFIYVAFTVGMTYQIADTSITGSALRLIVIRHALLSYVFGTVIVATTVSVIAGLGSSS
jgi:uncharacterized membrane protein